MASPSHLPFFHPQSSGLLPESKKRRWRSFKRSVAPDFLISVAPRSQDCNSIEVDASSRHRVYAIECQRRRDQRLFDAHYSRSMLTGQAPSVYLLSALASTSFVLIPSRFLCLDLGSKLSSAASGSANPSLPDSLATAERFCCSQAVDDECLIAQPPSLIKPSLPFD